MAPHLRMPFPSLSADNFLSRGAAGHVFQISRSIVFKCPTQFDDPFPQQAEEMEESIKKIEAEKAVHTPTSSNAFSACPKASLCVEWNAPFKNGSPSPRTA